MSSKGLLQVRRGWRSVLERDVRVGGDSKIFDLGGQSFVAGKVIQNSKTSELHQLTQTADFRLPLG